MPKTLENNSTPDLPLKPKKREKINSKTIKKLSRQLSKSFKNTGKNLKKLACPAILSSALLVSYFQYKTTEKKHDPLTKNESPITTTLHEKSEAKNPESIRPSTPDEISNFIDHCRDIVTTIHGEMTGYCSCPICCENYSANRKTASNTTPIEGITMANWALGSNIPDDSLVFFDYHIPGISHNDQDLPYLYIVEDVGAGNSNPDPNQNYFNKSGLDNFREEHEEAKKLGRNPAIFSVIPTTRYHIPQAQVIYEPNKTDIIYVDPSFLAPGTKVVIANIDDQHIDLKKTDDNRLKIYTAQAPTNPTLAKTLKQNPESFIVPTNDPTKASSLTDPHILVPQLNKPTHYIDTKALFDTKNGNPFGDFFRKKDFK